MVVLEKTTVTHTLNIELCAQELLLYIKNLEQTLESKIFNLDRNFITELLLDSCSDCANMACLPQGAFAACKLREQRCRERDLIVSRMKSASDKSDTKYLPEDKKPLEYSPVKYNDKLMNSIWGFYNRYSPHNIKGNEYDCNNNGYFMQQRIAVASRAIAETAAMAMGSGNEWRFLEKKGSD